MREVINWIKKQNEWFGVLGLIALIWYAAPPILRLIDPQSGEFGIEVIYVPLIAGIYFLIALLFIWGYLKIVFPKGFKLLDNLFRNAEKLSEWESSKLLLQLFGWLVVLFSISLLAVSGISAIM